MHYDRGVSGLPTDPVAALRAHGLRVTPQRRAILSVFGGDGGHLSADQVLERAGEELPELSRATVYNTLGELVRVGLLQRVDGPGATLYDPNLDADHHHFRCRSCDGLFDVHPAGADAVELLDDGFVVQRTQVLLEGLCPSCAVR